MHVLRLLLVALLLGSGAAEAASPKRAQKAQGFALQADVAWEAREVDTAVTLATKALKFDKDNVLAVYTLGNIAMHIAAVTEDSAQAESFTQVAVARMAQVVRLAPDSLQGALAADYLEGLAGADLMTEPAYSCSEAARAADRAAELSWQRKDWAQALVHYDEALALCPENASWWLHSGDALFGLGDYAGARARYQKAEALFPCYWSALRFSANAYIQEGKIIEGITDATRAVACNPTYDTGWRYLANVWQQLDAELMWERTAWMSRRTAEKGTGVARVWAAYWVVRETPSGDGDALGRERRAVARALEVWTNLTPEERGDALIWPSLADAHTAGQLDAAIYIWLLDADLLPSFEVYRVEHQRDLVTYITQRMVRKPK